MPTNLAGLTITAQYNIEYKRNSSVSSIFSTLSA
jgi:hypothetical protein